MIYEKEYRFKLIKKHKPILTTDKSFICLHGGRIGAKSHSFGRYFIAESFKPNSGILCTREIQKSIRDSVHTLLKDVIQQEKMSHFFNIRETYIENKLSGNDFVFAGLRDQNIDSIKSYENRRLCWVEEAHSVSTHSLGILIPTITRNKDYKIGFSFNRCLENDPVFNEFCRNERNDTIVIKSTIYDNEFATIDALKEAERMKLEDYNKWLHVYMGEPMVQGENCVIDRITARTAMERTVNDDGAIEVGVDVARFGDDDTVIAIRKGLKLIGLYEYSHKDTHETAENIKIRIDGNKTIPIKIDDTGVGGGVTDQLKADGYKVVPINFNETANEPDKYPNSISEMWFSFRDTIKTSSIINNERLFTELTTRKYKMDKQGRRAVESKEEYKKRGFKSPDVADAVLLCYYTPRNKSYYTFV